MLRAALFLWGIVWAQVIILPSDLIGVNKQLFRIRDVDTLTGGWVPPGNNGLQQQWNYQFKMQSIDTLFILPPSATPYAMAFPSANRAELINNVYEYFVVDNSGIRSLGVVVELPFNLGAQPLYNQPNAPYRFRFPWMIAAAFSDTVFRTITLPTFIPGMDSIRYIQWEGFFAMADADGQLTINGYLYPEVVRRKVYHFRADTFWVYNSLTQQWSVLQASPPIPTVRYIWTSKRLGADVLELVYTPAEDSLMDLWYVLENVVKRVEPEALGWRVYTDWGHQQVVWEFPQTMEGELVVYDALSRQQWKTKVADRKVVVKFADWAPGVYFWHFTNSALSVSGRFVVWH